MSDRSSGFWSVSHAVGSVFFCCYFAQLGCGVQLKGPSPISSNLWPGWTDLGSGCCIISNVNFQDNIGNLEDCMEACVSTEHCGYVSHGWTDGKGPSEWCSVVSKANECERVETDKCGSRGTVGGVHVFKYEEPPNMCLDGRRVPEVFLIGAQKASTSQLAVSLNQSTAFHYGHFNHPMAIESMQKESHVFDSKSKNDGDWTKGKAWWRKHYPRCLHSSRREVFFDGTPNYLKCPDGWEGATPPAIIAKFYGALVGQLKLIVILREPLARLQSAWYHGIADGFCVSSGGLAHHIEEWLATWGDDTLQDGEEDGCDNVDQSMYASNLAKWLSEGFVARQFTVIPMALTLGAANLRRVTKHLWTRLGLPAIPDDHWADTLGDEKVNPGSHPPLGHDIPPNLQARLVARMVSSTQAAFRDHIPHIVRHVNSNAKTNSAVTAELLMHSFELYGFDGNQANLEQVDNWLSKMWMLEP